MKGLCKSCGTEIEITSDVVEDDTQQLQVLPPIFQKFCGHCFEEALEWGMERWMESKKRGN